MTQKKNGFTLRIEHKRNFVLQRNEIEYEKSLEPKVDFDKEGTGVLKLSMHPGMVYPKGFTGVKAVLIQAYHGGTLCVESIELQDFVNKAKEEGVLVYLVW